MTQDEIAKRIGVSQQTVSKWYQGKSQPSLNNLQALSVLLKKDVGALLTEFIAIRNHGGRKQPYNIE